MQELISVCKYFHNKKYINFEMKLLKTGKILSFINVNNMGSHNVRKH